LTAAAVPDGLIEDWAFGACDIPEIPQIAVWNALPRARVGVANAPRRQLVKPRASACDCLEQRRVTLRAHILMRRQSGQHHFGCSAAPLEFYSGRQLDRATDEKRIATDEKRIGVAMRRSALSGGEVALRASGSSKPITV
jgi:hypothetical protein